RDYCNKKCGVVLGHGIGELSGKAFRVAHMGHVNAPMVLGTLSGFELALTQFSFRNAKAAPRPPATSRGPKENPSPFYGRPSAAPIRAWASPAARRSRSSE